MGQIASISEVHIAEDDFENVLQAHHAHFALVASEHDGTSFEIEAEGLLAVAIQHEYDHLQGQLMIDHMGPLKKRLTHRRMVKRAEELAAT